MNYTNKRTKDFNLKITRSASKKIKRRKRNNKRINIEMNHLKKSDKEVEVVKMIIKENPVMRI